MTIKKLKEMIQNLPDDMRIYADDSSYDMFGDDASEFVCLVTSDTAPGMAVLQSKRDIDIKEETSSMCEIAAEFDWDEQDFWTEVHERGYKPEDFYDSEWAEENLKHYGLTEIVKETFRRR